jgi:hypothetical protein
MASFGAVQGVQSFAIVSSYGIYDRDVRRKLDMKFPRAGALSWMRAVKGRMGRRRALRHEYSYWEEGQWMNATATIAVEGAISSGLLPLTLSAGDHFDSGKRSFPVENQLVLFEDETVGRIDNIDRAVDDAHVIHVRAVSATQDIETAAAVGGKLVFFSNAQIEKSFKTESRIPRQVKITNFIQTFREAYEVTDHEEQNITEFEYKGQKYLYVKGTDETADRFEYQEELGLLVGQPSDVTLVDKNSEPVKTVTGLIPEIALNGQTNTYSTAPDMADFDAVILKLQANYGEREYIVGRGINLTLGMKNFLIAFEDASPDVFFNELNNKEQNLYFKFRSVDIENYTFHFQEWECLSHPDTLGIDELPYKDMGIFIPAGSTRDPVSGNTEPYMKLVYSDPGGAPAENKGDYKLFETGGNARSGATDDEMIRRIHWVSYKALETRHRHKFLNWRLA